MPLSLNSGKFMSFFLAFTHYVHSKAMFETKRASQLYNMRPYIKRNYGYHGKQLMVSILTHEPVEWGRIPRSKPITNQIESRGGGKLETKSSQFFGR